MSEVTATDKKDMEAVLLEVGSEECVIIPYNDLEKTIKALLHIYNWLDPMAAGRMLTRENHD